MPQLPDSFNKTRIAPTPSGYLHLGNIASFALTAFLARKSGAKILLRIDDLDQARANRLYLQDIFNTLNFLEIPWDEGPENLAEFESSYSQLHRLPLYNQALKQLEDEELVFACDCSRSSLAVAECVCSARSISLSLPNISWRLRTDANTEVTVKNYNGSVMKVALPPAMQHFVVRKKDGFPAYQLTSLVDDLFFGIDLIVRGEDLWPSTLAQHTLAKKQKKNTFFEISFFHHPLLMNGGQKLSKSAGDTSVRYLAQNGKKPAEIYKIIGGMLGIKGDISNYQQLGANVIKAMKL
ncbi:glutamate--tRNA ligase family protein [Mucilaginibacter xinganensis]|uniref:Glutamyl/glutaminyl-tRNA synthetase class Ib catalytic domain-containing protein n=1 Tax=Mucilaginibacter xinganensis TaxID=1234841 RepID=A0A223NQQ8_9SPHI|nr:glutamate--tRNA ligase family protein [Mucilaginibacter xinganensis]ASU31998.1 hypothetical protein MuYL_0095 [Mucilaginibacter xinganensis]